MSEARRPLCLGVAGGSGSGKSWLADYLKARLGPRATVVSQDWYYRHNGGLSAARARRLNFDHPDAIEADLFEEQLRELLAGRAVRAPRYDYATHSRLKAARAVRPAPLVIVEGLLVLHEPRLRALMDFSVFIEVPDDIRLLRRIRRDVTGRRVDLAETLRLYEHCVKPMHEKFIRPSARAATWIWRQEEDARFPRDLARVVTRALDARGPTRTA